MAARRVVRKAPETNVAVLAKYREEYLKAQEMKKKAEELMADYRTRMVAALERDGYEDDRGHKWLDIDEDEGVRLKYEKRVGQKYLDSGAASEWAKEAGLWDKVKKVIETLDEDKLVALGWDDKKVEKKLKSFYKDGGTSWALKV